MAPLLFSHVGSSRSFLLSGSFLSFYDMTPPLVSHVNSLFQIFALSKIRFIVWRTLQLSHAEGKEHRASSKLAVAETRCGIHSCGVGWGSAHRSELSTNCSLNVWYNSPVKSSGDFFVGFLLLLGSF